MRRLFEAAVLLVLAARTASPAVTITDATDEGIACFKIVTDTATYFYDKAGAAFTSIVDNDSADWIGYHPTGGSAGNYRGIPNLGGDFGHPGSTGANSTKENSNTIRSTKSGWSATWEFFDTYAKMTLESADANYWILYEGTPGGAVGSDDHIWLSNGKDFSCYDYHQSSRYREEITNTSGKAAGAEWAFFADGTKNRTLVYGHDDDDLDDEYWEMENNMTVFGFGRTGMTQHLTAAPVTLIVALVDSKDPAVLKDFVDAVWQGGPPPPPVPEPPTGVSATDGTYADKVRLTWNSSSGATSYEVWRSTANNSGSATRIRDNQTATTYDDGSVTPDTTYYYWVKAENAAGTSGFSSSDAGHAYVDQPPPESITVTAPTGGAYKGKQDVTIRWTSSNIPGGVKIEFSENGGSSWQVRVSTTENDGSHTLDVPNTTSANCRFRVSDATDGDPWDDSGTFSVTQINDQDGDRLDDDWERSYWGDITTSDGTTDTDGDGSTDLQEFWRGNDPTVAESDGAGAAFGCGPEAPGAGPGLAALALVMVVFLRRREAARGRAALP